MYDHKENFNKQQKVATIQLMISDKNALKVEQNKKTKMAFQPVDILNISIK